MDYQLADGIAVLERTPGVLRAMLTGLPTGWIDATEGSDTWSPYVIIGHLIHGERDDWVTRARIVLAQEVFRGATRLFASAVTLVCLTAGGAIERIPADIRQKFDAGAE